MAKFSNSEFEKVVKELESYGIMPDRAPGLEVMQKGLQLIGYKNSPFYKEKYLTDENSVVIVAGTNGKGSVCATLESLLLSAGERVLTYTSPHLVSTNERIRINGKNISEEKFVEVFKKIRSQVGDFKLSHFEMLTLMAAQVFAFEEDIDRVILEVGLGGTWDATNAIPHKVCVISQLGLDHQNILGEGIVNIARNKFGVVGQGSKVIYQKLPAEVKTLAEDIQKKTQSQWIEVAPFEFSGDKSHDPEFKIKTEWGTANFNLPGLRGASNTALALSAFSVMGYNPGEHLPALSKVSWPGRMEKIAESPCRVFLSGDHNPQGVKSLIDLLSFYDYEKIHFLVGIGKDKGFTEMLDLFSSVPKSDLYLTETPFKGCKLQDYEGFLSKARGAWADPMTAYSEILKSAGPDDTVLVTGSLYLVGAIRKEFT